MYEKNINKQKRKVEYVNSRDFYLALVEFKKSNSREVVPPYIVECIMQICNKLGNKPCFSRYTYREDMIADAYEKCFENLNKFELYYEVKREWTTKTRHQQDDDKCKCLSCYYASMRKRGYDVYYINRYGKKGKVMEEFDWKAKGMILVPRSPNPFSYFTQIAWNSFVQRITKEKRQTYIKHKNFENQYISEIIQEEYDGEFSAELYEAHYKIIEDFENKGSLTVPPKSATTKK